MPDFVPEIIEIGAVKVNIAERQITDSFSSLVKPKQNPILSTYCTELTGISQEDLSGVGQFPEAYAHFMNWSGSHHKHVLCAWGRDWEGLTQDCLLHGIPVRHRHETLNAKMLYSLRYKRAGLDTAMKSLNLTFTGRRHRALDDAKATAEVLLHLL